MHYRFTASLILMAAAGVALQAHAQYNDPPSTYPGMEALEPDATNLSLCQELPLIENFSNESHYDGTSQLPIGWHNTGSVIWQTANIDALPAASGTYYMISPESMYNRDERAYTPFFNLQKGVTYTISFSTHQEATTYQGVTNLNTIVLRVGTQHDADFLPVSLGTISSNDRPAVWVPHTFTFCPAVSGPYTFCFELQGTPLSGFACVDDLRISSPLNPEKVEPLFHPIGIYDASSNALFSMGTDPTYFINYSNNGTPQAWSVNGQEIEMLPDGNGSKVFNATADYDVTLKASNITSEESLTKKISIRHIADPIDILIRPYDVNTAQTYNRGELPAFTSDPYGLDYVSGPNHYYSAMAEYFQVPWQAELTISRIDFLLASLRYCPMQSEKDYQGNKPFRVKFYGSDGNAGLDTKNLIASFSFKTGDVFGTTELGASGGENRTIDLPRPVTVTGPFFLVFEFSEDLIIDPYDPTVGRTFIGIGTARHIHGKTTLFCKPYAAPMYSDVELDEWMPVSRLSQSMKGMSLNLRLTASYRPSTSGVSPSIVEAVKPECRLTGSMIEVSNAGEKAPVSVYSTSGTCLLRGLTSGGCASLDASVLPQGIYIIKVDNSIFRIIK